MCGRVVEDQEDGEKEKSRRVWQSGGGMLSPVHEPDERSEGLTSLLALGCANSLRPSHMWRSTAFCHRLLPRPLLRFHVMRHTSQVPVPTPQRRRAPQPHREMLEPRTATSAAEVAGGLQQYFNIAVDCNGKDSRSTTIVEIGFPRQGNGSDPRVHGET